jgi:hypothetical protein
MNKTEYILAQLAQEASEISEVASNIAKIATKSLMFGLESRNPHFPELGNNIERLRSELTDLHGMFALLDQTVPEYGATDRNDEEGIRKKIEKVRHYMKFAEEIGTLTI